MRAAKTSSSLLGAVEEHGEERVRSALEAALAERRIGLLDLIARTPEVSGSIAVPKPAASNRGAPVQG